MTVLLAFYVGNATIALILWAYRSLYEDFMQISVNGAPGWKHYAGGFVLCFVPLLNIVTGSLNFQWAILNLPSDGAR